MPKLQQPQQHPGPQNSPILTKALPTPMYTPHTGQQYLFVSLYASFNASYLWYLRVQQKSDERMNEEKDVSTAVKQQINSS